MPKFSKRSRGYLDTCHPAIKAIFECVVKHFDCSIIEGYRGAALQDMYYNQKKSQVKFPNSRHNKYPSLAVHAIPYPLDWQDRERMHLFAGYVLATAQQMGFTLRWGGDWDRDTEVKDNKFDDLIHFEMV